MAAASPSLRLRETALDILRAEPETRFTARDLAFRVIGRRPEAAAAKLARSAALADETALIQQIVAEIGASAPGWKGKHSELRTTDGKPRRYYWSGQDDEVETPAILETLVETGEPRRSEADLYPILASYMAKAHGVRAMRIDERRGSNKGGAGGNHWLFPDLAGMEVPSERWDAETKLAADVMGARRVRLWSFEVKLSLGRGTLREAFFQAVSNSSWANVGYLVAAEVREEAGPELRMLSALHGIGVLLLDPGAPSDSQIFVPARERAEIDWDSLDRLARENADAATFLRLVRQFHQTGDPRSADWQV